MRENGGEKVQRNIKKQFYVNAKEDSEIKRKAELVCLTEAALIRQLLGDFIPREKPDEEFYELMNNITKFASELEAMVGRFVENEDVYTLLFMESGKWNAFRSNVEEFFLRPEGSNVKWQ